MIGQTLGHRIIEKIGAGGMGTVCRAHDDHLDREVAVKVLAVNTLTDKAARDRFRKEALTLSRLSHPNVATVFDFDTEQDVDFLAMELILGSPLSCILATGLLDEAGVLKLGMQLADGLAAAHAHGVLHRDLKPGNLMVTPDGRLKILRGFRQGGAICRQMGSKDRTALQLGNIGAILFQNGNEKGRGKWRVAERLL